MTESKPAARDPLALHHHNSNASICSTHSLNPERNLERNPERDTASVGSFDSAMSTPSPTPLKEVISKNPFVFPPDVSQSLSPMNRPVSKPRTPIPSSPYHVACVDPRTHSIHVSSTSTHPHLLRPTTPDHLLSCTSSQEGTTLGCRLPKRTSDEGFCEERDSKQKGETRNEATYMNTHDNTDIVNLETEPKEPSNYENIENSHYVNPIIPRYEKNNIGPKVAPKPQPPNLPPRKRGVNTVLNYYYTYEPLFQKNKTIYIMPFVWSISLSLYYVTH